MNERLSIFISPTRILVDDPAQLVSAKLFPIISYLLEFIFPRVISFECCLIIMAEYLRIMFTTYPYARGSRLDLISPREGKMTTKEEEVEAVGKQGAHTSRALFLSKAHFKFINFCHLSAFVCRYFLFFFSSLAENEEEDDGKWK